MHKEWRGVVSPLCLNQAKNPRKGSEVLCQPYPSRGPFTVFAKLPGVGKTKGLLKDRHLDSEGNVWARTLISVCLQSKKLSRNHHLSLLPQFLCIPRRAVHQGTEGDLNTHTRPCRLLWNCHFVKINSCAVWLSEDVGWDLEYTEEKNSPPGSCVAVSFRLFCKGPI